MRSLGSPLVQHSLRPALFWGLPGSYQRPLSSLPLSRKPRWGWFLGAQVSLTLPGHWAQGWGPAATAVAELSAPTPAQFCKGRLQGLCL